MNATEAGRILAVAISLDPRMPQPDAKGFIRGVWADALAALEYDDAYQAVLGYYSSEEYLKERNPISPADIVVGVRKRRAVGSAPPYKALPAPDPASEETRASALAAYREVAARLPEVRQIGRLPWSQQTRKTRTSADEAQARKEAADALEQMRPQLDDLAQRRAQGEFLRRQQGAS
jgi:hypothetical protein